MSEIILKTQPQRISKIKDVNAYLDDHHRRVYQDLDQLRKAVGPLTPTDLTAIQNAITALQNQFNNLQTQLNSLHVTVTNGAQLTGAPVHSNSAGQPLSFAYDNTYLYLCVALNTWVRWPIISGSVVPNWQSMENTF